MPNNDISDDLLVRPEKSVRKAGGVVEPTHSSQGDESGYDLTNPNLHHGAEAKYAPTLQVVTKSGSIAAPVEEEFHEGRPIGGSSHLAVSDSASTTVATADQTAFQDHSFALNVSSHSKAPNAGDALSLSAKLPTGISINAHID